MLNLAIKSRPATDTRAVGAVAVVEPKSCRMRAVVRRYVTETAIVEFSGSETDDRYLLAEQLLPLIPDDAWTRSAEASPSAYIDSLEPCEESGEIDGGMLRSVDAPMRMRGAAEDVDNLQTAIDALQAVVSTSEDDKIAESAADILDAAQVLMQQLAEPVAESDDKPASRSNSLALQKRSEDATAGGQNTIDDEIRMLDSSAQRYTAYLDEAIAKNDPGIATDVANIVTGLLDRCGILQNNINAAVDQLNEKHGVAAAIYQEFMALTERATQVAEELAAAAESEA